MIFQKKILIFFISLNVNNSVSFQIRLLFVIKKNRVAFSFQVVVVVYFLFFFVLQISERIGELTI